MATLWVSIMQNLSLHLMVKTSFKTSLNRGRLGKEPYDCDGISDVDAKKIIEHYKNNSEETNFKI